MTKQHTFYGRLFFVQFKFIYSESSKLEFFLVLGTGFDPIQTLTASDLLTYGLTEDEEETDITVV